MVELRHLRYFVAVAEELHFGRAAERVGITLAWRSGEESPVVSAFRREGMREQVTGDR